MLELGTERPEGNLGVRSQAKEGAQWPLDGNKLVQGASQLGGWSSGRQESGRCTHIVEGSEGLLPLSDLGICLDVSEALAGGRENPPGSRGHTHLPSRLQVLPEGAFRTSHLCPRPSGKVLAVSPDPAWDPGPSIPTTLPPRGALYYMTGTSGRSVLCLSAFALPTECQCFCLC